MNVCDRLTRVCVKKNPITYWIKNSEAKTIAAMLEKPGTKQEDITFICKELKHENKKTTIFRIVAKPLQ